MELAVAIAVNVLLGLLLYALHRWVRTADTARLDGAGQALALFHQRMAGLGGDATLIDDGRGALIATPGGGVGLLQRHGSRWNARLLTAGDLAGVEAEPDGGVTLRLADFGWPRARLRFADSATHAAWMTRLESLMPGNRGA